MQCDALALSASAKTATGCAHDGGCLCSALQATNTAQGNIRTTTTVTILEPMKPTPPAPHLATVQEALSSNKPTAFTNSLGQTEQVQIDRDGQKGDEDVYEVRVGDDRFKLQMPKGEDPAVNLALAINFFSMNLPEIRDELDLLRISPDKNPTDAEFAKTYNIPNFSSAATAGGGVITFWHEGKYLDKATFDHEMAHLMSPKASSKRVMMPDGYEAAIAKDEKTPTSYSKAAPIEDFADSWSLYQTARQTSPEALARFHADYPNRAAMMDQFWSRFAPGADKAPANPAVLNGTPPVDLKTLEVKREYRKIREERTVTESDSPLPPKEPAKTEAEAKPPEPEAKLPEPKAKAPEPKAKPPEPKAKAPGPQTKALEPKAPETKDKPPLVQDPLDVDTLFANQPTPDDLRRKMETIAPDAFVARASQARPASEPLTT
ncbi:MAG TPA: hypothetical protein V6D00_11870 [Pantanalinema sp.]